ncbi:MAG: PEGA domain-containing protein [Patescibacteria group bacterium]
MGYRFNPQRGIFVFTGSISIKSNPLTVQIFIDQKEESKSLNRINNSYHVGGIKPGEHLIEIKAPGFKPWSKKISVSSGTTTEFWNVALARDEYPKTDYQTSGTGRFFFDPGKKLIAYIDTSFQGLSVNVLDVGAVQSENVFSSQEFQFTGDKKENIEWSPQSKKIIIPALKNNSGEKTYFIVDTKTKEPINLKDLAKKDDIKKVRWDQENKNFIYYISEGNLYHLDTENPDTNNIIAQNIADYDLSSGYAYYFQLPGGIVYRTNSDGTSSPEQITTSSPDRMTDSEYQITVYDQDRIAILNKSGDLYIYNNGKNDQYFKNLASGIYDVQFSNDGKKMLYFGEKEASVYFLRDWEVQPWRSENDIKEIVRFSEKIDNVQWSKDYEHILFTFGGKLKMAEIDNRSQNNMVDVFDIGQKDTEVVGDFGGDKIYFTDNDANTTKLYSIDFPEKTGLFGF